MRLREDPWAFLYDGSCAARLQGTTVSARGVTCLGMEARRPSRAESAVTGIEKADTLQYVAKELRAIIAASSPQPPRARSLRKARRSPGTGPARAAGSGPGGGALRSRRAHARSRSDPQWSDAADCAGSESRERRPAPDQGRSSTGRVCALSDGRRLPPGRHEPATGGVVLRLRDVDSAVREGRSHAERAPGGAATAGVSRAADRRGVPDIG